MCVCVCVCVCLCVFVCWRIWVFQFIHGYQLIDNVLPIYLSNFHLSQFLVSQTLFLSLSLCLYTQTHAHTRARTHTHTHTYIYIYIYNKAFVLKINITSNAVTK